MKARGKEIVEKGFALMDKELAGKEYAGRHVLGRRRGAVLCRVLGAARRHDAAAELRRALRAHEGAPRGRSAMLQAGRPGLSHERSTCRLLTPSPFWFLRHGETDWNAAGPVAGQRRHPAERDRAGAGAVAAALLRNRGIATHRLPRRCPAPASPPRSSAGRSACRWLRRRPARGVVRRAGGPADARMVHRLGRGRLHAGGAETFAELRHRAVDRDQPRPGYPPPVLVVAHGALFRALRAGMGLEPNVRTPNAVPIWCEPPASGETAWTLHPAP